VALAGRDLGGWDTATICRQIGYLPQVSDDLLFAERVRDEPRITLANHGLTERPPINPDRLLRQFGLGAVANAYPRDLSVGQRLRVALAAIAVTRPWVLLLDEPTRGLDRGAKSALAGSIAEWRKGGAAILIATHDVEWLATIADEVSIMQAGQITASGAATTILGGTDEFATQIAHLLPGSGCLTVADALRYLQSEDTTNN
jgi:energy-coupling factor transport system ATP-binding protein